jgi:predicted PurR-regulated permease PerM
VKRKNCFIILVIPLILLLLFSSRQILGPFVIAFFLAYAINPVVDFIERKGARRDYAVLTVYLIGALIAAFILGIIIPRLIQDFARISQKLSAVAGLFHQAGSLGDKISNHWALPFDPQIISNELAKRWESMIRKFLLQVAGGIINLFSQSFLLGLIPLLSYYMSRDYPRLKKKMFRWLLQNLGAHWTRTFLKIDAVFRLYIRGQLLVTLIVAILLCFGLSVLGFETAILLGLIAGVFNFIPYFGPVLGALPAIFLGLLKSPWYVLYVILLFGCVNQIEAMFLTPRIIGSSLGIHPITVLYLVLVGGKVFGVLGMIFAIPLGALVLILFSSVYEICFDHSKKDHNVKLDLNTKKSD